MQTRHVRFLLGLYLKRKRSELSFSEDIVASHLDLTTRSYRKMEAGQSKISEDQFRLLQDLLNFEPEDLIEIRKIVGVQYINDLSAALSENYPA